MAAFIVRSPRGAVPSYTHGDVGRGAGSRRAAGRQTRSAKAEPHKLWTKSSHLCRVERHVSPRPDPRASLGGVRKSQRSGWRAFEKARLARSPTTWALRRDVDGTITAFVVTKYAIGI